MKKKKSIVRLERKSTYTIEDVLSNARKFLLNEKKDSSTFIDYDGDTMKMASERYKCFVVSGTKCVSCGIEGKFFAKERYTNNKAYHFNLYAIDKNGEEVMMTKDHIHPKSKGGRDSIDNYQTMCIECNIKKGDKVNSLT